LPTFFYGLFAKPIYDIKWMAIFIAQVAFFTQPICYVNMATKSHQHAAVSLFSVNFFYGAILAAITVLNWFGADRWWLGALNLYLPQSMWLIPGILLTCFTLKFARRWIWLPVLCVFWVAGPIMGFCWPLHLPPDRPGSMYIRVMTCNAKNGKRDITALINDILCYEPNVVLLQDAEHILNGPLGSFFREWNVRSFGQYVLASKFPISESQIRSISIPGENYSLLRCELRMGGAVITVYNVHLETPREGLNAFRPVKRQPSYLPQAVQMFENNVEARLIQARTLSEYISKEQGPVIVAGDLNSPDASLACAMLRNAGLHDAFAESGKGYGYTYGHFLLEHRLPWMHFPWMRIDHIMTSSHFQSRRCWAGTEKASEHRPVIADLILKRI
jgi:endonuclease/exonuclease/phosphatase family metal-dependent hydrolase